MPLAFKTADAVSVVSPHTPIIDDASVGSGINRIKCVFQGCVVSVISAIGRFHSDVAGATGDFPAVQKVLIVRALRRREQTIGGRRIGEVLRIRILQLPGLLAFS